MSRAGDPWSDEELVLIVRGYLEMLAMEEAGLEYSKSAHRRALEPFLAGRSGGSIDFKHCNISAVLNDLGRPWITGYKPYGNYQAALSDEVIRQLGESPSAAQRRAAPADAKIARRGNEKVRARGDVRTDTDPLLEPDSPRAKYAGQRLVFEKERAALVSAGHDDLAEQVLWRALEPEFDGPYDILSYAPSGAERHIRVKTTTAGPGEPFPLTSEELGFARRHPGSYEIHRVYDIWGNPVTVVFGGGIEAELRLTPVLYRAEPLS